MTFQQPTLFEHLLKLAEGRTQCSFCALKSRFKVTITAPQLRIPVGNTCDPAWIFIQRNLYPIEYLNPGPAFVGTMGW